MPENNDKAPVKGKQQAPETPPVIEPEVAEVAPVASKEELAAELAAMPFVGVDPNMIRRPASMHRMPLIPTDPEED